jgi:hypothetical protein
LMITKDCFVDFDQKRRFRSKPSIHSRDGGKMSSFVLTLFSLLKRNKHHGEKSDEKYIHRTRTKRDAK